MYCFARKPACYEETERLFAERAAAVRAFDPELVIVFGPDHFNGFFLNVMPPFCAGLRCVAVGDIGGFAGSLRVPADDAMSLIGYVRESGVDLAVSYDMTVDHGFSQTMFRILGALDSYPVIPIFVNGIAPPYTPFKRSRLLGKAIGEFAAGLGRRTLLLASGGMSHNPTRYYPKYGTGDERVTGYQLAGGQSKDMSHGEWLARLDVMHREGAKMLVDGSRTRADLKLNPEIDARFLDILVSGDLGRADSLDPNWLVEHAGIGSLEMHTWVAAAAASAAAGGSAPVVDIYAEALEYGIAFGMLHAG
jgi:2,3-dihydroxyphenylpropionate 1,2-dioxygenase